MLCQRKFSKLLTSLGTWCHKDKTHNPNRCPQHQRANRAFCRVWWCRFTCSKLINSRQQDIANTEVTSREDLTVWLIASNFSQTKSDSTTSSKVVLPFSTGMSHNQQTQQRVRKTMWHSKPFETLCIHESKVQSEPSPGSGGAPLPAANSAVSCGRTAEHDKNKSYCESDRETERHHHLNNLIWNNVMSKKVL